MTVSVVIAQLSYGSEKATEERALGDQGSPSGLFADPECRLDGAPLSQGIRWSSVSRRSVPQVPNCILIEEYKKEMKPQSLASLDTIMLLGKCRN